MELFFHLFIHFLTSALVGYVIWKLWKKPMASFMTAFVGGVLIDLDHFIDYFLAFGWSLNLIYFAKGYQFLKSDKIYILFHGWEYVFIALVFGVILFKNMRVRVVLFAFGLGMLFHLITDTAMNEGALVRTYSVTYRVQNNFNLKNLVTNNHYIDHQERKKEAGF